MAGEGEVLHDALVGQQANQGQLDADAEADGVGLHGFIEFLTGEELEVGGASRWGWAGVERQRRPHLASAWRISCFETKQHGTEQCIGCLAGEGLFYWGFVWFSACRVVGTMQQEQMDPKTTAIVLVGYQNDYFAADGILRGVIEEPNRVDSVLANTLEMLRAVAGTEMTIISTPIILTPDYRALAETEGILGTIKNSGAFRAGSTGADTIPEILAFGDRVLYVNGKQGFNAFSNTDLEETLRERGITHFAAGGDDHVVVY